MPSRKKPLSKEEKILAEVIGKFSEADTDEERIELLVKYNKKYPNLAQRIRRMIRHWLILVKSFEEHKTKIL